MEKVLVLVFAVVVVVNTFLSWSELHHNPRLLKIVSVDFFVDTSDPTRD
jgi:hypothetical protein